MVFGGFVYLGVEDGSIFRLVFKVRFFILSFRLRFEGVICLV